MSETARGAEFGTDFQDGEIVKVRVQSTPEEIDNFHKLLNLCEDMGLCNVMNFSSMFSNKGTSKYYRAYSDIKITSIGEK